MKPLLLLLTNVDNGAPEEDIFLKEFLEKDFEVLVAHPLECATILDSRTIDSVLIRNIWPTHEYRAEWDRVRKFLEEGNIPTYNMLTGKGDTRGKTYLMELFGLGYEVIPTVDSVDDIEKLPPCEFFWIKPEWGCDGFGAEKVTKGELIEKNTNGALTGYIIQPYMDFECEVSFFFVDAVFSHAIQQKHRLYDDTVVVYEPSESEIAFAQRFVDWNTLPHGIQRVDAVRMRDGTLFLTEIEDGSPYLYLLEVPQDVRECLLKMIIVAIVRAYEIYRFPSRN